MVNNFINNNLLFYYKVKHSYNNLASAYKILSMIFKDRDFICRDFICRDISG